MSIFTSDPLSTWARGGDRCGAWRPRGDGKWHRYYRVFVRVYGYDRIISVCYGMIWLVSISISLSLFKIQSMYFYIHWPQRLNTIWSNIRSIPLLFILSNSFYWISIASMPADSIWVISSLFFVDSVLPQVVRGGQKKPNRKYQRPRSKRPRPRNSVLGSERPNFVQ